MRAFFLLLILNISVLAQDKYYLEFKLLNNFVDIQVNDNKIDWLKEHIVRNNYIRLDITESVISNNDDKFLISLNSKSFGLINKFGYWIKIYKNNEIVFEEERFIKIIQRNQKNVCEFLIDK